MSLYTVTRKPPKSKLFKAFSSPIQALHAVCIISELVAIVKLLAKLVSDVKTGYIDDMYAVNYALVNIL
jgi:hypothetical protein